MFLFQAKGRDCYLPNQTVSLRKALKRVYKHKNQIITTREVKLQGYEKTFYNNMIKFNTIKFKDVANVIKL